MIPVTGLSNGQLRQVDELFGYSGGVPVRQKINRAAVCDACGVDEYHELHPSELTVEEYIGCEVTPRTSYSFGYSEDIARDDHAAYCDEAVNA